MWVRVEPQLLLIKESRQAQRISDALPSLIRARTPLDSHWEKLNQDEPAQPISGLKS